ncbi:MAG: LuxR C-terminal-related transcriptional regulator [Flavobacteriales bacterium]
MKDNRDIIVDIWKSHPNYIGSESVEIKTINITDYLANMFCPGPFYYYVIDSPSLSLDFASDSIKTIIGINPTKFQLKDFVDIIHPDDIAFFMRCEDIVAFFLKNCISPKKIVNYKINYCLREKTSSGNFKLFLLQTVTLKTSEKGELLKVFGVHTDINHITSENNRRLSLIGLNGEPSYYEIDVFDDHVFENFTPYKYQVETPHFTKRELEILKLLAQGYNTNQISNCLSISPKTVLTHRNNMLQKFKLKNTVELIAKSIRMGYI